jgi:glycosyltransferase involved in cell wall biosynthesis
MKIAIVTDAWPPQISGVVTTLTETIRQLNHLGHQVLVLHPDRFPFTIPCPTYPQIRLAIAPGKRLRKMLNNFHPDAIHIVTEGPVGLSGRRYCVRNRLNFTTSFTTRFDEYIQLRFRIPSRWIFAMLRWFHSAASNVLISSVPLRQELESNGFTHTVLWPRGVDAERFRMHGKWFLSATRPLFMYVGRVAVEKSIEDFLKLDLPGTKYVVGDGPELNRLRADYPDVAFVGAKTGLELARHFAAADVFVFPSRTDTYGVVMLEAMASGVPVAAYPVRGPIDIVRNGETGFLDEDLHKAALQALELDPDRCREFALQFSWPNSAKYFINNLVQARPSETPVN